MAILTQPTGPPPYAKVNGQHCATPFETSTKIQGLIAKNAATISIQLFGVIDPSMGTTFVLAITRGYSRITVAVVSSPVRHLAIDIIK